MSRKTVAKKPASSKSKSAKRTKSAKKKPSPKGRKSTPRSTSSKAKTTKTTKKTKPREASDEEVTIDRRHKADRRADESSASPIPIPLERREKVQRRRQIDPTTCERDYSVPEVDFMKAMDEYKRKNGRMFPTCSEILEVIRDLGYVQLTPTELAARRGSEAQVCLADASQEVATEDDTDDSTEDDLEAVVASESEQF